MNRRTLFRNRRRLAIISVVVLCVVAICMSLVPPPKGVGPECKLAYRAGLQPVPAWDSPVRFEFRTSQGSGGGGFHRKSSDCPMAGLNAPDSDRSAPNTPEYGN